jgi:hypothetical protein
MKAKRLIHLCAPLLILICALSTSPAETPEKQAQESGKQSSQAAADETVKIYCAAWRESDIEQRRKLLETVWAPEGTYTDPLSHVEGREALVELIGVFLKKFPGGQIVPSSHADLHHGMLRFTWKFIDRDGKTVDEGMDFGVIGNDGRLQKIIGFFGALKPL